MTSLRPVDDLLSCYNMLGRHVFVHIFTFIVPDSEKREIPFVGPCLFLGVHSGRVCLPPALL